MEQKGSRKNSLKPSPSAGILALGLPSVLSYSAANLTFTGVRVLDYLDENGNLPESKDQLGDGECVQHFSFNLLSHAGLQYLQRSNASTPIIDMLL
ncbi:hypothetical protein L0665_04905 [Methanogenium marinum]|uniref:Uncharacterized protein n=1 Tax=Methanogenium marinum TaxID=348610 RepID=A0A9Q4PY38_9EURY|nr:hypothetical protein [Methanogenium marinum]MDE4907948.1 hypothetical protein [Methanogenium marinum]